MESLTRSAHHHPKRNGPPAIQQDRNAIAASQDLKDTFAAGVQQLRHTSTKPTQSVSDHLILRHNAPRRHRNGPSTSLSRITSGVNPVIRWLRMIAARARFPTTPTVINDHDIDAPPPTMHELVIT
ncbi:hypothetical protein [Streptomyces sp. NPDC059080]|uniref:hypothetical protein n=1 Tax=Streptomyces sp. NPDC059080 TaxID=3346718 RepID=UPI0036BFFFB5